MGSEMCIRDRFFGWEGVGLCSYFLIGFWFKKESANKAAIKAFVVNRVGDFGFALGIFLIFYLFGTVNYTDNFLDDSGDNPIQVGAAGADGIVSLSSLLRFSSCSFLFFSSFAFFFSL